MRTRAFGIRQLFAQAAADGADEDALRSLDVILATAAIHDQPLDEDIATRCMARVLVARRRVVV
jgi:hypothetical protein